MYEFPRRMSSRYLARNLQYFLYISLMTDAFSCRQDFPGDKTDQTAPLHYHSSPIIPHSTTSGPQSAVSLFDEYKLPKIQISRRRPYIFATHRFDPRDGGKKARPAI